MTVYGGFDPGTYQAWALNIVNDVTLAPGIGRGLQVTQNSPTGMSVLVTVDPTAGDGVCVLSNGGWVRIDAQLNLSVPNNSSGSVRNDAVVATMDPTGGSQPSVQYIINWAGGFGGASNNQFVIATLAIPNNASTVVNADITMNTAIAGSAYSAYTGNITGSNNITVGGNLYVNGNSIDLFGVRPDPASDVNPGLKLSSTNNTLDVLGYSNGVRILVMNISSYGTGIIINDNSPSVQMVAQAPLGVSRGFTIAGIDNSGGGHEALNVGSDGTIEFGAYDTTSAGVQLIKIFTGTTTPTGTIPDGSLWFDA